MNWRVALIAVAAVAAVALLVWLLQGRISARGTAGDHSSRRHSNPDTRA